MKRLTRFLAFSLLAFPLLAFAHGTVYFEFAPDAWASKRLIVSAGEAPYQLFQPASDLTLTAFDLWADNTGEAGPVTFILADSEGTTLATKNITLPELAAIPGGNRLHVNLPSDVQLHAGTTYSIKIDSSLLGFGLYYADRLLFLDHNQEFTSEYINGTARLGQVEQPFTFKLALRTPESAGATSNDEDAETSTPTVPAPTQHIAISNARVTSVTATTATLAWSTDIASNSSASARNQINPLYVVSSAYDPTFELEHTLTITGLSPSANYFADVFSSQGSELVLTTYTISFTTLAYQPVSTPPNPTAPPPAPPAPTTPAQQPSTQQTAPPSTQTTPPTTNTTPAAGTTGGQTGTATQGTGTSGATGSSGTTGSTTATGGPAITVGAGSDSDETAISWNVPAAGAPTNGYRIDIFDRNHNLERQIRVPAGTNIKEIAQLDTGLHHVVIYADNDGVYTKVAPSTTFLLQSKNTDMLWKIIVLVILWVVGLGGYFRWKFKKEKTVLSPEEGYDPNR